MGATRHEMGAGRRWWHPPILLAPDEGVFTLRQRQLAIAAVCVTVPLVTVLGTLVRTPHAYLVAWSGVSLAYAVPALVVTWRAAGRAATEDRRFWRLWWLGLALIALHCAAVLVVGLTDLVAVRAVGAVAVAAAMVAFGVPLVSMMRRRSGGRALSLDLVEGALVMVGTASLAPLVVGQQVLDAPNPWFTLPAAVATVGLVCSLSWAVVLFVRLDGAHRVVEALGVALALLGAASAAAQVAHAIADYALPTAPLLGLQALVMGLALITPLHLPRTSPAGLDRFPPQQQVRKPGLLAAVPLLVVPVLAVEALAVGDSVTWAGPYVAAVVTTLLVLSTVRHVLAASETHRLYAAVGEASEARRRLLADVIAAADQDRHRIAAQLHEQAASTYVALNTYARSAGAERSDRSSRALRSVGDDLERRAEALRGLMVAVAPLEVADHRPSTLVTSIGAYVHSLYADEPAPALTLHVEPGLELDWTTETIAVRIAQEALRNVHEHAHAALLDVRLAWVDGAVELTVTDDGAGFDPAALPFESGIAAMRTFAGFADGHVSVSSAPGGGTVVRARLGAGAGEPTEPPVGPVADAEVIDLRDRAAERRRTSPVDA